MDTLSSSSGGPDLVDFLHATVLSPKGLLSLIVSIVVILLVVFPLSATLFTTYCS